LSGKRVHLRERGIMKRTGASITTTLAVLAVLASAAPAWAQRPCTPTLNNCPNQTVTTSRIQIGGVGSLSSNGPSFSNPGRLDDGTIAEADLDFTFDRSTGRLTLVATNRTTSTASLTAIGFNAPPDVTLMTLVSETGSLVWEMGFDADRLDDEVEIPAGTNIKFFRMDGFGRFSVFLGNKGIDTGGNGGDASEILAGNSVTFVTQVTGNIGSLTACSFTSVGSIIPPGDKIVTAVGRFQAGVQGGSGFIGPCTGGPLVVDLAGFEVEPFDKGIRASWRTATEMDNAGFNLVLKDVRKGTTRWANSALIPAAADAVSGASYEYVVQPLPNGKKYEVSLEDVDLQGFNTLHAPATVVPNPQRPAVNLLSPRYEERAGASVTLKWESATRRFYQVEISSDASFPAGGALRLGAGTRTFRTLGERELAHVRRLAAAGGEGGVYWRVTGRGGKSDPAVSQTFFLEVGD
jgi:hypothetical protein